MTVGPKFNNYSSKMGNAPKYKEPNKKIDPADIREAALQARIEDLVKERDEARIAINQIGEAMGVLGIVQCLDDIVAEAKKRFAKLTKAMEGLRCYAPVGENCADDPWSATSEDWGNHARTVLAELEGKG